MEFKNLAQLTEYFADKQTCIEYLTNLRWNGNVTCTFCGHDKVYELKGENKRFKCAKCRKIEGRERETPNDFTRLSEAIDKFKIEFIKAIRIPQIVEWISKQLK